MITKSSVFPPSVYPNLREYYDKLSLAPCLKVELIKKNYQRKRQSLSFWALLHEEHTGIMWFQKRAGARRGGEKTI